MCSAARGGPQRLESFPHLGTDRLLPWHGHRKPGRGVKAGGMLLAQQRGAVAKFD